MHIKSKCSYGYNCKRSFGFYQNSTISDCHCLVISNFFIFSFLSRNFILINKTKYEGLYLIFVYAVQNYVKIKINKKNYFKNLRDVTQFINKENKFKKMFKHLLKFMFFCFVNLKL